MVKIYLGPAGIPTSSKEYDTVSGIKTVADLKLNAMEIEFVKGIYMDQKLAKEVGKTAEDLDVRLSVHAPYYINLCSEKEKTIKESKQRILISAKRAEDMGATVVVIHAGYYGRLGREESFKIVKKALEEILDRMKESNVKNIKLGIETTGRIKQFGTFDEVVELCKQVDCLPVIDFAHIFARDGGKINYSKIFDRLSVLNLRHLHSHFEGVKWKPVEGTKFGNETYHVPITANQPPFEPLAKEILEREIDITIISESPVLEQDSLRMVGTFKKLGYNF